MDPASIVFDDSIDVDVKLHSMGLTQALLREAVQEGQAFVDLCTLHDPPAGIGMLGWMKTVRALRDRLVEKDWTFSDRRGYSITTHPTGQWSIAVLGGNGYTGIPDRTPTNRAEKGVATRDAVAGNAQRHFSELDPVNFPRESAPEAASSTWMLLSYPDERAGEIRIELSLPRRIDEAGFVTSWSERILIGPAAYGQPLVSVPTSEDDDDRTYEASVTRKAE